MKTKNIAVLSLAIGVINFFLLVIVFMHCTSEMDNTKELSSTNTEANTQVYEPSLELPPSGETPIINPPPAPPSRWDSILDDSPPPLLDS